MSIRVLPAAGVNHLLAGVAAAVLLPTLVFAFGVPFVAALPIAAVLYIGLAVLLAPRRSIERIDVSGVGKAQAELVAALITDAEVVIARLNQASRSIKSSDAAKIVSDCAATARGILDALAAEPAKLSAVRRFLTYYLPRSAELAEGLALLENQRQPDAVRTAHVTETLTRLEGAFRHYADSLADAELDQLDTELKLLDRAMSEDLAPMPTSAPQPVPVAGGRA